MSEIKTLIPKIYENVREMDAITDTEDKLIDWFDAQIIRAKNNQFLLTADETGIAAYESMLGIKYSVGESIEFRRERLIHRFSMQPPFTLNFLKQKLDSLIGSGAYNAYVNNDKFTLYIESSAANQEWYHEILVTIHSIKPANIVFINMPLVHHTLSLSESVDLKQVQPNYALGTTWKLGALPFSSLFDKGVIKMSTISSVTSELLNKVASFAANEISGVLINDTISISDFTIKTSDENIATIEYEVPPQADVTHIFNIKLLDVNSNVLTSSNVYIPLIEMVLLKHTLTVKES